jgi:hypothetical protein
MYRVLVALQMIGAVGGLAGAVYLLLVPPASMGREVAWIPAVPGMLSAFFLVGGHFSRRRVARAVSQLAGAGFEEDPPRGGRARVLHLDRVAPGCSMKVRLAARGSLAGLRVHVAEYVLPGFGHIVPEQTGFEVAVQVRGPRISLALTTSLGFMGRPLGQLFERPAPALGDLEFSKRWDLACDHMRGAAELLRPELRAWLVQAPGLEAAWVLADGWLSCTWATQFNQPALVEMVGRLRQFVQLSRLDVVACDEPYAAARVS